MAVTNQQGSITKCSTGIKVQGSLYRFSNLVTLNSVSSPVRTAVCKCLFRNRAPWFSEFNRPTDLNFNVNNRQGTLFNFGFKKSRTEGVCDATNSDSSTANLQSDLQDIRKEGKLPAHRRTVCIHFVSTRTAIYNLVSHNALTLTDCHALNVSFELLFWEMKLWSHRDLSDISTRNIPI